MNSENSFTIIDKSTILNLNIEPKVLYEWAEQSMYHVQDCILPQKIRINFENAEYAHFLPCAIPMENVFGVKVVTRSMNRTGGAIDADILLYDKNSLELIALMDGSFITQARTAAVSVCAMLNAVENYDVIAMVGLGGIGTLIGKILFEKIKDKKITVKLFDYKDHAKKFIDQFQHYQNIKFEICNTYEKLMSGSDVVFSSVSYIENDFCDSTVYKKGCTVIPVHLRGFMECDREFDHIITSDLENVKNFKYYKDFKRLSDWNEIISGKKKVRENPDERVLIYYSGLGVYDIYFAKKIWEIAK